MEKLKTDYKLVIGFIVGIMVSAFTAYITTSYALTENGYAVNSSNVEYKDNASLGVTNVQAAIDGTCTKFSNQLAEFKKSMYPVGSIYLSTSLSSPSAVASKLGGTWEVYGQGRTLVGVGSNGTTNYAVNNTGGKETNSTTLTKSNLPSHSHTISHTHTTGSTTTSTMSLTAQTAGNHGHRTYTKRINTIPVAGGDTFVTVHMTNTYPEGSISSSGAHVIAAGEHTHSVTGSVTIPVLSTNTISTATSGSTGEGTSFTTSTMQPYIVVYMYRRTA